MSDIWGNEKVLEKKTSRKFRGPFFSIATAQVKNTSTRANRLKQRGESKKKWDIKKAKLGRVYTKSSVFVEEGKLPRGARGITITTKKKPGGAVHLERCDYQVVGRYPAMVYGGGRGNAIHYITMFRNLKRMRRVRDFRYFKGGGGVGGGHGPLPLCHEFSLLKRYSARKTVPEVAGYRGDIRLVFEAF